MSCRWRPGTATAAARQGSAPAGTTSGTAGAQAPAAHLWRQPAAAPVARRRRDARHCGRLGRRRARRRRGLALRPGRLLEAVLVEPLAQGAARAGVHLQVAGVRRRGGGAGGGGGGEQPSGGPCAQQHQMARWVRRQAHPHAQSVSRSRVLAQALAPSSTRLRKRAAVLLPCQSCRLQPGWHTRPANPAHPCSSPAAGTGGAHQDVRAVVAPLADAAVALKVLGRHVQPAAAREAARRAAAAAARHQPAGHLRAVGRAARRQVAARVHPTACLALAGLRQQNRRAGGKQPAGTRPPLAATGSRRCRRTLKLPGIPMHSTSTQVGGPSLGELLAACCCWPPLPALPEGEVAPVAVLAAGTAAWLAPASGWEGSGLGCEGWARADGPCSEVEGCCCWRGWGCSCRAAAAAAALAAVPAVAEGPSPVPPAGSAGGRASACLRAVWDRLLGQWSCKAYGATVSQQQCSSGAS